MRPLNIYNISTIVTCVIYIGFAYFAYIRRRGDSAIKKFVAFCIVYSLYCFSMFLLFGFYDDAISRLGNILNVVGAFTLAILCDFLLTAVNVRKKEYWFAYLVPIIFLSVGIYHSFNTQLIEYENHKFPPRNLILASGIPIFFIGLILYTWWCFRAAYKITHSPTRLKFLKRLFRGVFLFIPAVILDILFIAAQKGIFPFSMPILVGYVYQIIHVLDLEAENRQRMEYVVNLVHELKSPLTPIQLLIS